MQFRFDRSTSAIAASVLALVVGYVAFVFLPQQRGLATLSAELATQRDYVDRTGDLLPAIQTVQQELEKTNAYNTAWQEHTPGERQLATLFGRISELAKVAGTTTTRFDPDPVVAHDQIRKIPLKVGCRGSFSQIARFLRDLEGLPQAIWVEHIGIERAPQSSQDVQCEVNMVIFADNPDTSGQAKPSGKPI